MNERTWDAVVIGGGPAGSTAAAALARPGRSVLLLEKGRFPRYHVGESLVPGCLRVLDAIGARQAVEAAGFPVKRGVAFAWGGAPWRVSFAEQQADPDYAFQVDRARFDHILLRNAQARGVTVCEGVQVTDVVEEDDGVSVVTSDRTVRARYLIDASGRASLLAARHAGRVYDEALRNVAIWSYYEDVAPLADAEGDIAVEQTRDGWVWAIPLDLVTGRVSVGAVLSSGRYKECRGQTLEQILAARISDTFDIGRRSAAARCVAETRVTSDWSYRSAVVCGDRWLLVGDAAGFVDPLLSSGCHLAMASGYLSAMCVATALEDPLLRDFAWVHYAESYAALIGEIHPMVLAFYGVVHQQDAFAAAASISGDTGDVRQAFIRLISGNSPVSRDAVSNGLPARPVPSELFGETTYSSAAIGHRGAVAERSIAAHKLPAGFVGPHFLELQDGRLWIRPLDLSMDAATGHQPDPVMAKIAAHMPLVRGSEFVVASGFGVEFALAVAPLRDGLESWLQLDSTTVSASGFGGDPWGDPGSRAALEAIGAALGAERQGGVSEVVDRIVPALQGLGWAVDRHPCE